MRKNGVLTYLHSDHLGSTVLETNITGTVTSDEKYLAYGKQRDSGKVVTDHRFTGHPSATLRNRKEDASGLQYFNARFYDPSIGTFVSPDTLVTSPADSLSYNRYLYSRANPLRFNDPSGHDFWDVVATVTDFVSGVGAQVGYNNSVTPDEYNVYTPQANESTSMGAGRHVGNVVSAAQGALEMVTGGGMMSGGVAMCATGVGCLATPAAEATGAVVAGHGAYVASNAVYEEAKMLGNWMFAKTNEQSSSSSSESSQHGKWTITKENTERVVRSEKFGRISKSKSDGLWWSKDQAGHGGSVWKVFEERSDGLHWIADADEYGDFITGKHKGDTGMLISWSDLVGVNQ